MSFLNISNLTKRFGDIVVFENVNAEIERGEVISIIGPSGTGKSTFLGSGSNVLRSFYEGTDING
jgi:ABC-type sugar transport system ATPase subunit